MDGKPKPEPPCRQGRTTVGAEVFSRCQKFKSSDTRGWGDVGATIRMLNQETSLPLAFCIATFIMQVKVEVWSEDWKYRYPKTARTDMQESRGRPLLAQPSPYLWLQPDKLSDRFRW